VLVFIIGGGCLAGLVGCATESEQLRTQTKRVLQNAESRQMVHRYFSAGCFNKCWALIDKKTRTPAEAEEMLLLANASLWHWTQRDDCKPENLSVAYWQLARVYYLAGDAGAAGQFARRCVKVSVDGQLPAFYLGYGYEALANATLLAGEADAARENLGLAEAQLAKVADAESRKLLVADLDKLRKQLKELEKLEK